VNFPETVPDLVTERLTLRALAARDIDALFAMFSDTTTLRFWGRPAMTERRQAETLIEEADAAFAAGRAIRWAIERRADAVFLGTATLFAIDAQNRRAEIGYILDRATWGQGYMREALAAILRWGFGPFGLHRVEADVDPRNIASLRAVEVFGFAREGLLRERWRVNGEISDSVVLGLLANEWARSPHAAPGNPQTTEA